MFSFGQTHILIQGGVKNSFGTVVLHPTAYDGCLELAGLQLGMWVMGTSTLDTHYKSVKDAVKNHLIQDPKIKNVQFYPKITYEV